MRRNQLKNLRLPCFFTSLPHVKSCSDYRSRITDAPPAGDPILPGIAGVPSDGDPTRIAVTPSDSDPTGIAVAPSDDHPLSIVGALYVSDILSLPTTILTRSHPFQRRSFVNHQPLYAGEPLSLVGTPNAGEPLHRIFVFRHRRTPSPPAILCRSLVHSQQASLFRSYCRCILSSPPSLYRLYYTCILSLLASLCRS
jgi:hypothetical protein